MRKLYNIFVVSLITFAGCTESYSINVHGFKKAKSSIPPNARIFVATELNAANPIFENEVKTKIETLLRNHGYQVVETPVGDYRLTFQLGLGRHEETSYASTGPHRHGVGFYVPHVKTIWDQWLRLKLYRADTVVWVGEAVTSESYADKRKTADYLIVAALEFFGQDTASRRSLEITAKDPRIAVVGAYAK